MQKHRAKDIIGAYWYTSQDETPLPGNVSFYDWYGGLTETDPLAKQWIGATQHDSKSAEASAITWALLFYLQTCDDRPVHLYCDPLTVLEAAKGNWKFREDDTIMLRTRATYLLISTYLKDKLTIQHVRGHSGHFGNEMADRVAGAVREGVLTREFRESIWRSGTTGRDHRFCGLGLNSMLTFVLDK